MGGREFSFTLENGMVVLQLRRATQEEMATCEVVHLMSDTIWDPRDMTGDNFSTGADPYVHRKSARNNTTTTIFEDDALYESDDISFIDYHEIPTLDAPTPKSHGSPNDYAERIHFLNSIDTNKFSARSGRTWTT